MSAASDRLMTMGAAAIYAMLVDDAPTTAAIADEIKRLGVPGDEVALWFSASAAVMLAKALGENLAAWHVSDQVREAVCMEADRHFA